jgi:hypothetical protein
MFIQSVLTVFNHLIPTISMLMWQMNEDEMPKVTYRIVRCEFSEVEEKQFLLGNI